MKKTLGIKKKFQLSIQSNDWKIIKIALAKQKNETKNNNL